MPCVSGSAVRYCTVMCVLLYYAQINGDEDGDGSRYHFSDLAWASLEHGSYTSDHFSPPARSGATAFKFFQLYSKQCCLYFFTSFKLFMNTRFSVALRIRQTKWLFCGCLLGRIIHILLVRPSACLTVCPVQATNNRKQ